jgi:hypothetical protein
MAGEFQIHVIDPDSILMIDDDGGEPAASYADSHNAVNEVVTKFREWLITEIRAQRIRREAKRAAWQARQEALARRGRFAVVKDCP